MKMEMAVCWLQCVDIFLSAYKGTDTVLNTFQVLIHVIKLSHELDTTNSSILQLRTLSTYSLRNLTKLT